MNTVGHAALAGYERALRLNLPRTGALLDVCRWAIDARMDDLIFPALLAYTARFSTVHHPLLAAARLGTRELLDALGDSDVEQWDEAIAAGWSNTFPRGWMNRMLNELCAAMEGQ